MIVILFSLFMTLNANNLTITNKNEFAINIIEDGLKILLYSKAKMDFNNITHTQKSDLNIYSECLNFVEEMKKYRNNIDEYSKNIKSYCETTFGNPDKSFFTFQNICQYIIDVIAEDIKDDFLPSYINDDLCNIFK